MGLLRVFLALSVLANHVETSSTILRFVGGQMAVEIFFAISGFYMQMVLSSQRYASAKGFYISRALRIFPAYWIIAITVLVVSSSTWTTIVGHLDSTSKPLVVFSNIAIFFQDLIVFSPQSGGSLSLTAGPFVTPLFPYLIIPVAWTLALELYFYLLAPFLARRSNMTLIVVVLLASVARVAVYIAGFDYDPWTYRFFPFEIALFLCGMLAQRFHARMDWSGLSPKILKTIGWICVLLFVFSAPMSPPKEATFLFAMLWAAMIPFIFEITKNWRLDRAIGELSYPIYLVHTPLIAYWLPWVRMPSLLGNAGGYVAVSVMSIALAAMIWLLIDRPIDHLRHRWLARPQATPPDI